MWKERIIHDQRETDSKWFDIAIDNRIASMRFKSNSKHFFCANRIERCDCATVRKRTTAVSSSSSVEAKLGSQRNKTKLLDRRQYECGGHSIGTTRNGDRCVR